MLRAPPARLQTSMLVNLEEGIRQIHQHVTLTWRHKPKTQRLVFKGKILQEGLSLKAYGIVANSALLLQVQEDA